jgi:hypothetical protein
VPSDLPSIQFPCPCGHPFDEPLDRAGAAIQCPKCGRLNDVPTLSDLQSLSADGTLLLKPGAPHVEPHRVAVVNRHFNPHRTDAHGNEIDLRNTHDDLADIGAPPEPDQIPLRGDDARPAKPKYDPLTGELIRPLKLATPAAGEDPSKIPVAKRALTYAAGDAAHVMNARRIFVAMLMPANFVVMVFVFLAYFAYEMLFELLGFYILNMVGAMPTLYTLPLAALLMAHYANTLEDNGPNAMDELPRPLRSLSLNDDLFTPFSSMFMAIVLCFLPPFLVFKYAPPQFMVVSIVPLALGLFFFPAVFLTTVTAGTTYNLRPDRLAAVIRVSGGQYLTSLLAWTLALPLFAFSLFGVYMIPVALREKHLWIYKFNMPALHFPILFLSIMIIHFACWHLGLIYRNHHDHFPWILQRHLSTRRQAEAAKAAEIRARRRRAGTRTNPVK